MDASSPFTTFLNTGIDRGGFETDDVLAAILPLMREVLSIHEAGDVAPLRGLQFIVLNDDRALGLASSTGVPPERNDEALRTLQAAVSQSFEISGEVRRDADLDKGSFIHTNLQVGASGEAASKPVYLPGYVTWEHSVGHHDELTDIHSLGLLLASLACGLDFGDREDVERFANARGNLFALARRLHPVIAGVIVETTELLRAKRAQDLPSLIRRLETYRDQPVDIDIDALPGLEKAGTGGKRKIIQTHLRDRLFEISRRNKLIYFKATQSTLNLTVASVPLVLDYRNIKPEQLLFWHPAVANEICAGNDLPLHRWLRLEDAPYIPGQLDKLISEARRDRAEYGFSQLRLALVFLRWHNLKEAPQERIHSPLLLLPVELVKKKGVKDQYILEPLGTEAEVNPALRHHLKQLYNLDLPEFVDLKETSMESFHQALSAQIRATEPGVALALTDKPRIQLIYDRARQRADQYRRRMAQRGGKMPRKAGSLDYSYDRADFRPLGLELFRKKVMPAPLPLRDLAGAPPVPRMPNMAAANASGVVETERQHYALVEEGAGNPYAWEFDVCSLTLANFNYRKMTLVRDYANLIDNDLASDAFDKVFSLQPKTVEEALPSELPLADQHPIIVADATQSGAIAKARKGGSLIIQGPPGTGKSQTITNLIADYVARGKRVLFVCEKRAAIDVVFHRLRQQGLDELCCLIHDSQTDKKAFVLNLKQTYEDWLAATSEAAAADAKRTALLRTMEAEFAALDKYVKQMSDATSESGAPLRELVNRLIELRGSYDGEACPELTAVQDEMLPHYDDWRQHGDAVIRLGDVLHDLGVEPVFARHPLRWLGTQVVTSEAPLETLADRLDKAEQQLDALDDALQQTDLPLEHWDTLGEVAQLLETAVRLLPIARKGLLALLDSKSKVAESFARLGTDYDRKIKAHAATQKKTVNWRDKLPEDETTTALAAAEKVQGFFGFLNPAWWRLKKVLTVRYDFSKHAVKPAWKQVLADLAAEHAAAGEIEAVRERCAQDFASDDVEGLRNEIASLSSSEGPAAAKALREQLLASDKGAALVETLAALAPGFVALRRELNSLLFEPEAHGVAPLAAAIRDVREEGDSLPEMLPALRDLAATPERLGRALRLLPLTAEQFEAGCASKTLEHVYRSDRMLQRFDGRLLRQKLDRIARTHRQWLEQNARSIRAGTRQRFVDHVQISNQSATVLTSEQKQFKKSYSTGRRELEHEFGKTMRYKSIRDLAADETGQVVRDLKPIWLMSPLSVSDTLPLETQLFDVVIFDEASQIPVEEAVPAACRAQQVIVVGDEMQLPPTSFFSASGGDDEDEVTVEEQGEKISVLMDADSFLTQCARNLPSTLLAWHYRSRYEALISFSNAAFYGGELYTIPDRQVSAADAGDLKLSSPAEAEGMVPALLSRPITFFHCQNSPYENRRNAGEAAAIARLVRGLLTCGSKLSIGIAAFSEAQQGEIESALDALASEDAAFGALLEAEYAREEDDQFVGLFVKNLENVQGDERDIILMSVCYGRDPGGRMIMNFGPINQRGGEKRLNVIFSRARHHMAIVSSIRHTDITNDYNDGARALKQFLQYAESSSRGEHGMARQVLEGLNPQKRQALKPDSTGDVAARQIAEALTSRGWQAETSMGQSRFRCDVAVRPAGAAQHQLAIMVDAQGSAGLVEKFHTQPGILRAFGWQVLVVLAKDWWHEPLAVIERIEKVLRSGEEEPAPDTQEEEPEEAVVPMPEPASVSAETPPEQAAPAAPAKTAAVAAAASYLKRYEFSEGGSRKFWEIGQEGMAVTVRFGRIGTQGQTQVKSFPDETRAKREVDKLTAEKLKKGYSAV